MTCSYNFFFFLSQTMVCFGLHYLSISELGDAACHQVALAWAGRWGYVFFLKSVNQALWAPNSRVEFHMAISFLFHCMRIKPYSGDCEGFAGSIITETPAYVLTTCSMRAVTGALKTTHSQGLEVSIFKSLTLCYAHVVWEIAVRKHLTPSCDGVLSSHVGDTQKSASSLKMLPPSSLHTRLPGEF